MAVNVAARHASDCRALITESAQAFAEDRTVAGVADAKRGFAEPGQLDRLKKYHGEKAAWVLSAWVDNWLSPAFTDWTLDEALRQVRCPVLALHGEVDEYGSPAHPERIAALTGGRHLLLENCGHVPPRAKPRGAGRGGAVAQGARLSAGAPGRGVDVRFCDPDIPDLL